MVNKTYQDERLSDGTKISDLTIPEEGIISSKVSSDPELYELELRRIFAKTWNFVAHETEIPNTNDYVTRFVGNDRVIVVRTEDGGVNVFLNACVHKGMLFVVKIMETQKHSNVFTMDGHIEQMVLLQAFQHKKKPMEIRWIEITIN